MAIDSSKDVEWNKQIEYMTKIIQDEEQQERNKDKEIEKLNNIIDNLNNIVANKIIDDYDIDTPLKEELNKARLKVLGLEEENNRLNNIIKELEKYIASEYYCFDNESLECEIAKNILDKLKELKEGK